MFYRYEPRSGIRVSFVHVALITKFIDSTSPNKNTLNDNRMTSPQEKWRPESHKDIFNIFFPNHDRVWQHYTCGRIFCIGNCTLINLWDKGGYCRRNIPWGCRRCGFLQCLRYGTSACRPRRRSPRASFRAACSSPAPRCYRQRGSRREGMAGRWPGSCPPPSWPVWHRSRLAALPCDLTRHEVQKDIQVIRRKVAPFFWAMISSILSLERIFKVFKWGNKQFDYIG